MKLLTGNTYINMNDFEILMESLISIYNIIDNDGKKKLINRLAILSVEIGKEYMKKEIEEIEKLL